MSLRPDDWSRVRETFEGALAFPADARPAYLSRTCGGDTALRQQVEALLASHERANSFLETPAVPPLPDAQTARLKGSRIDPYRQGEGSHAMTPERWKQIEALYH